MYYHLNPMSYIINQDFYNQNKKYYIYIHYTPDNIPFYVGKGIKNRCLHKHSRSKWWNNMVNKYGYYIKIQEINLSEDECLQREIYWINYFGRKQYQEGTLINLTNGGEGVSGRLYTDEEKELKSKFFKDNFEYLQSFGNRSKYFGQSLIGTDNPNYGNKLGNNPLSKSVVKLDLKGNYICKYDCLKEAEIKNNVKGVYQVCKGKRNQLNGFIYVYEQDYINNNYTISLGKTNKKIVLQIDINTKEIIKKYNSTQETKIDGFSPNNVAQACRGDKKSHKGFMWKYE